MSTYSKRINLNPDVLLEYISDDSNYQSNDYKVLTNLRENTRSYLSTTGLNTEDNNLFLVDSVLDKYSPININNFNFLRFQNYSTEPILYDKIRLYFPSGFDFYDNYLGFYLNTYTHGYDNNIKYSLTNYFYTKDNVNSIDIFELPTPFLYNSKYWVRYIEISIPSLYYVSNQRIITTGGQNNATPNSLNYNLTNGNGLSNNNPLFINFSFIISKQILLDIPYYYVSDLLSISIPQTPEFDEIGVSIQESTQGDFYEIYSTYMNSNENMDDYIYNEGTKGKNIELLYVIKIYEENILTTTQTIEIIENFSQKILFRPIIQFSNTTAAIEVELKIFNKVDSSYISKFGSLGITSSLNKYGRTLTRLNMETGVIKAEIYNKIEKTILNSNNNSSNSSVTGFYSSSAFDIIKVPYPVLYDKYRILATASTTSAGTALSASSTYVPNGKLEIILTAFDNIINFNIAKDINSDGTINAYDLTDLANNSKVMLVFKSDTDSVQKDLWYESNKNAFKLGILYFKVEENDYMSIKRIYDRGYDNFYIIIRSSTGTNTQLYSGKYVFYEDLSFVDVTTNTTAYDTLLSAYQALLVTNAALLPNDDDEITDITNNNTTPTNPSNMNTSGTTTNNYYYTNLIVNVYWDTNKDIFQIWLNNHDIIPKYNFDSVYFLERILKTTMNDIKSLDYVVNTYEVPINTGSNA